MMFRPKFVTNNLYDLRQVTISLGQFPHLYIMVFGLDWWFSNQDPLEYGRFTYVTKVFGC